LDIDLDFKLILCRNRPV